jgi:hypothetical protein
MAADLPTIPAGTLFLVTRGAYDDYGPVALVRAKADIDLAALAAQSAVRAEEADMWACRRDELFALLAPLVERVECSELNAGAYSSEPPEFTPQAAWWSGADPWDDVHGPEVKRG